MKEHAPTPDGEFGERVPLDPDLEARCGAIIPYMRRNQYATVRRMAKALLVAADGNDGYEGRALAYLLEADIKEGSLYAIDDRFAELLPKLEGTFAATLCRVYRLWADALLQLGNVEEARAKMKRAVAYEPGIDRRDRSLRARLENHYQSGMIEWEVLESGRARAHYELALPCVTDDTDPWNLGQLKLLGALIHIATDRPTGQSLFTEAVAAFTRDDDPLVYDHARALDQWGRATNQPDFVARAGDLYDSIGSRRLAGLARKWCASQEPTVVAPRVLIKAAREELEKMLPPGTIVGGEATYALLAQAQYLASNGARTFLLHGPTGAGKEIFAKSIARFSAHANGPFESVDCGTLGGLADSELFGHVKGAFTGATSDRKGVFELADGGTVFLDEVQNLTPDIQVKLLRALQEREIRPLGSSRTRKFNVILISGTNADLDAKVREGSFREDLYWRIFDHPIAIPPLTRRHDEIPVFAAHFVAQDARDRGFGECSLSPGSLAALEEYNWPGNLRQLQTVCRQLVSRAGNSQITGADVRAILEPSKAPVPHDSPLGKLVAEARDLARKIDCFAQAPAAVDIEGGLLGTWYELWRAVIGITYHREMALGTKGARSRIAERLNIDRPKATYHLQLWLAGKRPGLPRLSWDDDLDE